jgi:hypothetical protein
MELTDTTIPMVRCLKFNCTLSERICSERYRRRYDNIKIGRPNFAGCIGCEVGEEMSKPILRRKTF